MSFFGDFGNTISSSLKNVAGNVLPNPDADNGINGLVNDITGAGDAWKSYTGQTANEIATQNLEYQKQFNEQIFNREDNAYQRLAQDLSAAGLNPALAMQHSSGAGVGGSSSAPQLSYTQERALAPLTALLNIRKLLGDLDQQEATTASIVGKTANDAAMTQGQLSFMQQQGALYGSQKELNDLNIASFGRRLEFDLQRTAAQTAQAEAAARQSTEFANFYRHRSIGQMAENRWIDSRYSALVDKTISEARHIAAEARESEISNSFLIRSLELNLDLTSAQIKKLRHDNSYAPFLFLQQSMEKSLEIKKTMFNLEFAQNNRVPYGIAPESRYNSSLGPLGFSLGFSNNNAPLWTDPSAVDVVQHNWIDWIKGRIDRSMEKVSDWFTGDSLIKSMDFRDRPVVIPYK